MIKKIIDTNIYIDLFLNPDLYEDIFLSEGTIYLSSVVLMELIAGAHAKEARKSLKDLINFFKSVGRIIIPSEMDYEKAGEILARLQKIKGYDLKKRDSITNDCLIAASVRNIGGALYTQNKKDFQAIKDVFGFKVAFV